MLSSTLKCINQFQTFTNQIQTLLAKDLEKADFLCEKALVEIQSYDKSDFREVVVRFLTSFFKLFVNCPSALTDGLTKKYLSILRQIQLIRGKKNQKSQLFVYSLMEVIQKCYIKQFLQMNENEQSSKLEFLNKFLSFNIKGGNNLRQFASLFKKGIEKERQWSGKYIILTESITLLYLNQISFISKSLKLQKSKINQSKKHFLKLYVLHEWFSVIRSKFEVQIEKTLMQHLKNYLLLNSNDQNSETLALYLLLQLDENRMSFDDGQLNDLKKNGKLKERPSVIFESYVFNSLIGIFLLTKTFSGVKGLINKNVLKKIFYLFRSLHFHSLKSEEQLNNEITMLIFKIYQKFSLLKRQMKNNQIEVFQMIRLFDIYCPSLHLAEYEWKNGLVIFQTPLYQKIHLSVLKKQKVQIYFSLLFWALTTFNVRDASIMVAFEKQLCNKLFKISSQMFKNHPRDAQQFIQVIFFSLNLTISYEHFLQVIGSERQSISIHQNIFSKIFRLYFQMNNEHVSLLKFQKIKQSKLWNKKQLFQDLLDCIVSFFDKDCKQVNGISLMEDENIKKPQITSFSAVFYNLLNISSLKSQNKVEELSFVSQHSKSRIKKIQLYILWLYENDIFLRQNVSTGENVGVIENSNNEKIIVASLKKYFSITYGKINEMLIKKWVINKQYLIIWSLLFCNLKVKSICDQLIKSGVSSEELMTFFGLKECIIKQFFQYAATKDRSKFKLHIWEKNLQQQAYLLDVSIPSLLMKKVKTH